MFKAMTALFLLIALSIPALATGSAAEDYRHAMSLLIGNNQDKSDQDEALELLHAAADRGYAPGQTAMGAIYEEGVLRAQDIPQAILWYRKAAAQDDWIAQFSLGRIYFFGKGTARDTSEAKKWFTAAARSGDSGSALFLGLLNDRDQGASPNYPEAAKWYRQSAERGNPYAQEKLAHLLLEGRGVLRNPQEAYAWLLVAAELGNARVQQQLQSMENDLGSTGAYAARKQALEIRDSISGHGQNGCGDWPEQYAEEPTAPSLRAQAACEKGAN